MLRHQKYRMMHYAKTLSVTLMTITMREQDGSTVLPQPFCEALKRLGISQKKRP